MKTRYFAVVIAMAVFAAASFAQTRTSGSDKFLISAKAGAVNAIVGDVMVERDGGRISRLFKGDEVQTGEKVSTGADGKAEVLMNPGSYVRLGANSSFHFDSTDLDDVRIKIHKGSAIFEVFGTDKFTVDVKAGTSRFAFVDTGIYRVDMGADGNAEVSIVKGKVLPGLDAKKAIKSGNTLDYTGNAFAVVKYDKNSQDDLDRWSTERARQLSMIAKSLRPENLRNSLINSYFGRRWDLYNSFGLWIYDPFYRSFCFLPFGYGWSSPYGFGFGRSIWYYNLPPVIYRSPPTTIDPPVRTKTEDRGFADVVKRDRIEQPIWRDTRGQGDEKVRSPRIDSPVYVPVAPVVVSPTVTGPTRGDVKKP